MNCELKAGRELDALVAEKVMGMKLCRCYGQEPNEHDSSARCFDCKCLNSSPKYSTDIAAAWEVVEKLAEDLKFQITSDSIGWYASFHRTNKKGSTLYKGEADEAPHAICLAALKAVGA